MNTIDDLRNIEFEQKSYEDWEVIANNSLKNMSVQQLNSNYYENIEIEPYHVKSKSLSENTNINEFDAINELENNDWEILSENDLSKFDFIDIASFYYNGSNSIFEIAYALIKGLKKIETNVKNNEADKNIIYFKFTCSSEFYNQISKIRAFKLLFNSILKQYKFNEIQYKIYVENNKLLYSNLDVENNILRQTTQLISSVIAGINGVIVSAYDGNNQNNFSKTISKNINYILKNESNFDKIIDTSGGSYFIENLTLDLAEKSFNEFQLLLQLNENEQSKKYNSISNELNEQKLKDFSTRKNIMVGVNKYPYVKQEKAFDSLQHFHKNNYSSYLEKLYMLVKKSSLGISIANFGNSIDFKKRNEFTKELFNIFSFNIEILAPFETLEDALTTLSLIENRIIIVSTSNEIYKSIIPELSQHLASKTNKILLIAGNPKEDIQRYLDSGMFGHIYEGQNIIELVSQLIDNLEEGVE